jgi:hypothetical protein
LLLSSLMATGSGNGWTKMADDKISGEARPGGEVTFLDGTYKGGGNGTEQGTMEKRS